jgi:MFS family permease
MLSLAPLRVRNFRVLLIARTTSVSGDALTAVSLAFAVLAATGSVSDVGLVLACRLVPTVALLLLGGVVSDRHRREWLMAGSQAISGGCQIALAALLLSGVAQLWMMMALYLGLGCAQAVFQPASSGLTAQLLPRSALQAGNGMLSIATSAGQIVGPALGGLITAAGSPGLAIGLDGITFLVSSALLLRLHIGHVQPAGRPTIRADLLAGWQVVRSQAWLWGMISFFSVFQFAVLGGLYVLGPAVARSDFGGAAAWGVLLAASGAGSLAGGAAALRLRPRRLLVASNISILGVVPVFAVLALGQQRIWAIAAMAGYGCASTYSGAMWEAALQANVPVDVLSRVASYDWLGSTALRPIGLVLAGPVAALIGIPAELWGIAAVVTCGALTLLGVPSVRQLRLSADDQVPEETTAAMGVS